MLEIFPCETRGRLGYPIRAPGTWNPKHDTFSLIAFENVSPVLRVHRGERKTGSLSFRSKDGEGSGLTYRNEKPVYRGEFDEWRVRFAITAPRTRREKLKAMVDQIFRQVGREIARRNVELQNSEKMVPSAATLSDQLQEFDTPLILRRYPNNKRA